MSNTLELDCKVKETLIDINYHFSVCKEIIW